MTSRRNNSRPASDRDQGGRQRRVSVRGVRRNPPDLRKISRALAALAIAQVEAEAEAEATARQQASPTGNDRQDSPEDAA